MLFCGLPLPKSFLPSLYKLTRVLSKLSNRRLVSLIWINCSLLRNNRFLWGLTPCQYLILLLSWAFNVILVRTHLRLRSHPFNIYLLIHCVITEGSSPIWFSWDEAPSNNKVKLFLMFTLLEAKMMKCYSLVQWNLMMKFAYFCWDGLSIVL